MTELYFEYGTKLLPYVLTALAAAGMWLLKKYVDSQKFRDYFLRAGAELRAVVLEVEQTWVKKIKEGKEDDGKLSDAEKEHAMQMAIMKFKENWGAKGLARLARVLDLPSVDSWLRTQAEALVHELPTPEKK